MVLKGIYSELYFINYYSKRQQNSFFKKYFSFGGCGGPERTESMVEG